MVALHHVNLLAFPVVHAGPGAGLLTHNELVVLEVQSNTSNPMRKCELLDQLGAVGAAVEVDLLARSDGQDRETAADVTWRRVLGRQRHKLACLDLAVVDFLLVVVPRGDIVPAQGLSSGGDDGGLLRPDDKLDGIRVDLANLVGHFMWDVVCGVLGLLVDRSGNPRIVVIVRLEIPDAKNLLVAAGSQDIGNVEREGDGADDVIVLEDQEHLPGVGVPDLCGKVGGGRGSDLVVGTLLGLPGGALVAYKGADPVAGATVSEDGVAIWQFGQLLCCDGRDELPLKLASSAGGRTLASRDNKVLPISLEAGEADVGDGARVAVAG